MKPVSTSALFIMLVALLISSCSKKDNTTTSTNPTPTEQVDSSYIIAGLSDITMQPYRGDTQSLGFSIMSAQQEKISLAVEGDLTDMQINFTKQSAIPPFTSDMVIKTSAGIKNGTRELQLVGTSEKGKKKRLKFNVTINGEMSCEQLISQFFANPKLVVEGTTTPLPLFLNGYYVGLFPGTSNQFTAYLDSISAGDIITSKWQSTSPAVPIVLNIDCNNKTVSIPSVSINAYSIKNGYQYPFTVSGSGTIDIATGKMVLNYSAVSPTRGTKKYVYTIDIDANQYLP